VPDGWASVSPGTTPVSSEIDSRTWNIGTESARAPDGTVGDAFTFRAATSGDALEPGDSVTATVQTTVSCTAGPATWQIRVKQANSFSGPPGNDFQPADVIGRSGVIGTGGGEPGRLEFTVQPGDGQVATALPSVEVTVFDTCGNVASNATGEVDLALVQPEDQTFGGGGALDGGTAAVGDVLPGKAIFTGLTVSASGQGYALEATYPNLDTVTSNTFSVYDFYGSCVSGCGTSNVTTSITVGGTSGNVALSLRAASTATCEGLQVVGSAFTVVPPPGHTAYDIPVTLTINKRGLQGIGVANIVVCKNSGPGTSLETLGKCPKKGQPSKPCIVSQTSSNAGDAVIKFLINSVDPGGAGFGDLGAEWQLRDSRRRRRRLRAQGDVGDDRDARRV